jgi:hypothetical protein
MASAISHSEKTSPVGVLGLESDIEAGRGPRQDNGEEKDRKSEMVDNDESTIDNADAEADPFEVWWDGPDDPENPMNWTEKRKWGMIMTLSLITFLT